MYTLCNPIPGGSSFVIEWDDEIIEINLPPLGYTIDRIPNLDTGKASFELIRCEILNEHSPIVEQKWKRSALPVDWKKWRKEERQQQSFEPTYVHPKCDEFRRQEWFRKINGCWVAIGNRNNKPTEYVYLTGQAYDFFNWWQQDFGYPNLRLTLRKEFYGIQYAKDHPLIHGVALSTNRRRGKTSISMHNLWYEQSFKPNRRAGMQAQTRQDASDKFEESFIFGWKKQPDFFKPIYDYNSTHKSELLFKTPVAKGKSQLEDVEDDGSLNCKIDYRETKATSYDSYKLHDFAFEEPGKWELTDIYETLDVIIPSTRDNYQKIGFIFAPTTIEELEKGGEKFISMFEHGRPSLMKTNENGKTTSNLISIFIGAAEGYVFDEYGRSVVEDPEEGDVIIGENGQRIFEGAKSKIMKDRLPKRNSYQELAREIRKYPLTWDEAKMMTSQDSPFNVTILQATLDKLTARKDDLYIKGNFEWVSHQDGLVQFVRDDLNGRWKLTRLLDKEGVRSVDGDKRDSNKVTYEFHEGKKLWYPLNNKKFRIGTDPIRWTKTDDPRASKASAYVWQMYDPALDMNRKKSEWISHNFCAEYFHRPNDFSTYGEDIIKAMRYFGCSVLPEENVTNLRQYLESRLYGQFVLFKGDFEKTVIKQTNSIEDAYKGISSNDETVSAYVQRLVSLVENHGPRIPFPTLIKQMIDFKIDKRTKYDAVVGAGYTVLAAEAKVHEIIDNESVDLSTIFPIYDQSGGRSHSVDFQKVREKIANVAVAEPRKEEYEEMDNDY